MALAATSVGQLLLGELVSSKTGEFGQKYFNNIIASDTTNELGLPRQAEIRTRLTAEVYGTAQLAAAGATVLAAEVAAFAGLLATCIIAIQGRDAVAAWFTATAALVLILFFAALMVQLLNTKLSRYVVGEPERGHKKTRSDEPSLRRRALNNSRASIAGYFQRVRRLHTLTPYKTSIVIAAILSAVIGVLI